MISEFRWVKIKRKSGSILLDNQQEEAPNCTLLQFGASFFATSILGLLFAYWHYIICKSENQYTDKWEIEKKNILFFWNKKCECILKPMRFSRLVKCGRIHIENTNERLSR